MALGEYLCSDPHCPICSVGYRNSTSFRVYDRTDLRVVPDPPEDTIAQQTLAALREIRDLLVPAGGRV